MGGLIATKLNKTEPFDFLKRFKSFFCANPHAMRGCEIREDSFIL